MSNTIQNLKSAAPRRKTNKPQLVDALANYRKNSMNSEPLGIVIETIADFVISRIPYNLKTLSADAAETVRDETIAFGWQKISKIAPDADNKQAFNFLRIHMYHFAKKLTFKHVDRIKQETELHIGYSDWAESSTDSYSMESIESFVGDTELLSLINQCLDEGSRNKSKLTKQDHIRIRKELNLSTDQYEARLLKFKSQLTGEPHEQLCAS